VYYSIQRCKRVKKSVIAAELHAVSYGFDQAYVAEQMIAEMLGRNIPLRVLIDSRALFNVIVGHFAPRFRGLKQFLRLIECFRKDSCQMGPYG